MAIPFLNLIPGAVKGIWNLGSDLLQYRREVTKAKHDIKLEAIKSSSDWELAKITEVGGSWKDEFWTIVLAVPAILIMIAPVVELIMYTGEYHKGDFIAAVLGGMVALDKAPDWYITALLTAITASFGIKGYNHYKANGRKDAAADALTEFGVKVVKKATSTDSKAQPGSGEASPGNPSANSSTEAWPDLSKK
ncbi:hypothetical protein HWB92_gp018 [Serratia phage vB_SmaA_3M]|uniref:Holin n=1 Tax=Serratia phage vB_SmaA_3M TaxID=2419930 RepID=A0A3G2YS02_9CAUD|nr:hypothetical protein HWB92_gp018 [Serratia phage vB_SmaA_3M]AYP28276.1 hypothetical protein 3M_018 [Serratia phage vB_SmaA_3M]